MNNFSYTIPKPTIPTWTMISVFIVLGGVVALGVIAFLTFRLFNLPVVPSVLLSGVIEYSTFTAGVNLIRGNKLTIPEIVIGLIGSGVVNFIHFQAANAEAVTKLTSPVLLGILAVFPLLVIFTSSLWIGREVANHGATVKAWEMARDQWEKDQAAIAEAARVKAQEREQAERMEALKLQTASAERVKLAEIAAEERRAKREARLKLHEVSAQLQPVSAPPPETSLKPVKGTYEDFLKAMQSNGAHAWKAEEIAERFSVSERTGFTWLKKYTDSRPAPVALSVN